MYVILTRVELLFIYKIIQEIISMPKTDPDYPHNFMVNSWVFKGDESESEVKTNSGPPVCLLLVERPHFACVEHAQCPLLIHCVSVRVCAHTHTGHLMTFLVESSKYNPTEIRSSIKSY